MRNCNLFPNLMEFDVPDFLEEIFSSTLGALGFTLVGKWFKNIFCGGLDDRF